MSMKMKMNEKVATRSYKVALKEATKKNPNYKKVVASLKRALRSGDPNAAYALATWYLNGKVFEGNIKKAIPLLSKAAKGMVPSANYDLGIAFEKGIGVRKNARRAFELYLTASLLGDEDAVFETGRCYYYGIGIRKDRRTAEVWLHRADQLGVIRSE